VQFLMSHTVTALREAGGSIDHVEATDEGRFQRLRADAYVLAMGSLQPAATRSRWASRCRSTRPRATR
jgi:D-amino-acid dehydrogenase